MSSSKGVGVSSREMANFLPPEILRFLLIRPTPRQPVNFEPSEVYIIKLFNDFDRFQSKFYRDPKAAEGDKRIYELSQVDAAPDHWVADFQLVAALSQMPHLDTVKELEKRKGAPFTEVERQNLELRIRAAKYWVERYATEEEKTRLQTTMPARASELTQAQRAFLHLLGGLLPTTAWEADALQVSIFNAARLTPIDQPSAFKAIYRVMLDRENGPKAGNLLSFLEPNFVIERCKELAVDEVGYWRETAKTEAELATWLTGEKANITNIRTHVGHCETVGALDLLITMADGKLVSRRIIGEGIDANAWLVKATEIKASLAASTGLAIV